MHFTDTCLIVVYNSDTQSCTPRSFAFRHLSSVSTSIPTPASGDQIHDSIQPFLSCNTSTDDFALYEAFGTAVCIHLSSIKVTYDQAETECDQMNSKPFLANTIAKYSLISYINLNEISSNTWIGLSDRAQEGTYERANGEPLSAEEEQYIWYRDQPNGGGDCVEIKTNGAWNPFSLKDEKCWLKNNYTCELFDA